MDFVEWQAAIKAAVLDAGKTWDSGKQTVVRRHGMSVCRRQNGVSKLTLIYIAITRSLRHNTASHSKEEVDVCNQQAIRPTKSPSEHKQHIFCTL